MSRKLIVEVVGDTSSFEKSMKRSSVAATKFERDVSKMTRGVAAGSGVFRSLGRSVAFASGGFIAFEGATAFIRASVDAAREAQVAQRSLAAQMKAVGQSFEANRDRIEKVSRSYARFGFQNDEVIQSLTVLERGTRSINRAITLQGLTADLARAKNIRLADAANAVAKVFGGQETALRRAVPGLSAHAHGLELIREAQARLAGQAAANTTEAERFAATLHDTQEILGQALLPTLNKYLKALDSWLAKSENQEKLQRRVNATADAGATAFSGLASAIDLATAAHSRWQSLVSHLPGGKGGLLQVMFGATPPEKMAFILRQLKTVGEFAGRKTGVLQAPFKGAPGVAANWWGILTPPGGRPGDLLRGPQAAATAQAARRAGLTLAGRFNLAELRLAQAQLTATLSDDRKVLIVEKAITEQQLAQVKSLEEKTKLTNQLAGIVGQIRSIDQQSADALKQQAETMRQQNQTLKDRAQAIKSAVLDRLQRRQTGIENRRELRDALDQLRTARALGGPIGIRLARQAVTDARFNILRARLEAAPASLTRGGAFALGNVITINVHGVTDPDAVARKVTEILQRRSRHTSTQSRGPTAGAHAGPH